MSERRRSRWLRGWGIRARVATATTVIVALTLVLGSIALVLLVHGSLVSGLDDSQLTRAENVAAQLGAGATRIPNAPRQISLVQAIDVHGNVVAATGNIHGEDPILESPPPTRHATTMTLADSPIDRGGEFRVLAYPATVHSSPGWVYVASSLSQVTAATNNLVTLFAVGLPIVVAIVALVVWRAVGLALRPVEQVRRKAAEFGAADLGRRLPVPATHDEVARLTSTMNGMLDRLEEASVRQKQFIGDASHELRSPLAGLRAQVDVALAHPEQADVERVLTLVRDETERMAMLTEDLLYLAQSTEELPVTLAAAVDLDDLVLAEAARLRTLGTRTVTVHVQAARIFGSHRDLGRLLRNLADNAYEHAAEAVELRLTTVNQTAEVRVIDDGEGLPAAARESVFERFSRVDPSRPRGATGGGFGLGLAIAREIALRHHGTLTAHERSDGQPGAEFLLRVPLSDE